MANITVPNKNTGDQHTAAEVNQQTAWTQSPMKNLGAFDPAMVFDSQGYYDKYTLTSDIVIAATGVVPGQFRSLWIECNGVNTITLGAGLSAAITDLTNTIAQGTYLFMFGSFPDELGVNEVVLSAPNIEFVTLTPPTLSSITIESAVPTDVIMVFNEVVTGTDMGETLAGTTSTTFASLSGSGTNTLTGVLATPATELETITLSSTGGDIQGTLAPLQPIVDRSVTFNIAYEAEATALFARMATAGSEPDTARKGIINTLIAGLKTDGNWDKLDCLQIYAAHASTVSKLNWKADSSNGSEGGAISFTTDRGYTGDGAATYIDTNFNPSTDSVQSTDQAFRTGVYVRTAPTGINNGYLLGSNRNTTGPTTTLSLKQDTLGLKLELRANDFTPLDLTDADGIFDANTLYTIDRPDDLARRGFASFTTNTILGNDTESIVAQPDRTVYLLADNRESEGGAAGFLDAEVMVYFIGAGGVGELTLTAFKNRIDTYLTSLGAI